MHTGSHRRSVSSIDSCSSWNDVVNCDRYARRRLSNEGADSNDAVQLSPDHETLNYDLHSRGSASLGGDVVVRKSDKTHNSKDTSLNSRQDSHNGTLPEAVPSALGLAAAPDISQLQLHSPLTFNDHETNHLQMVYTPGDRDISLDSRGCFDSFMDVRQPRSLPSPDQIDKSSLSFNSFEAVDNYLPSYDSASHDSSRNQHEEQPLQASANDQSEKIKSKIMSAWNNVRHGWTVKLRTSFRFDDPIWLLGRCYESTPRERLMTQEMIKQGKPIVTSMEKFKRDFTSRIWFTYRQGFTPFHTTQISTDVGWGCMLRSGQMMLAQALMMSLLGREWKWYPQQKFNELLVHHQIVRLFGDHLGEDSPFSIHKLVEIGRKFGKSPGDWYGPASVAYILKNAMDEASDRHPILHHLCLYVAQDCTVYRKDVIELCSQSWKKQPLAENPTSSFWRPVIILIPVRLGGDSLNMTYVQSVKTLLTHDMCIGVIGGKPKHSVYFLGWQDDKLIYLDPHYSQEVVDVQQKDFSLHTYHCMSPRKMLFTKMDPSCTIGFFCKSRIDFENFCLETAKIVTPALDKKIYPMFVISDGGQSDVDTNKQYQERTIKVCHFDKSGKPVRQNSDDFVFL